MREKKRSEAKLKPDKRGEEKRREASEKRKGFGLNDGLNVETEGFVPTGSVFAWMGTRWEHKGGLGEGW